MRLLRKILLLLGTCLHMSCKYQSNALDIPLEVLAHMNMEQLPTITEHSPASLIAFPFEESFPMKCEATGNPGLEFRWTKNGQDFDPYQDLRLITLDDSGTFIIPNNGNLTEFQGNYRCFATNKLGTAMSEEIEFVVPNVPKFPKEIIDPIEVMEGQSVILECNPPKGIPPLEIYWMTIRLQHIEQDERVSVGLNGNLYFSNAIKTDSRRDYCCFAAFPRIRTIVQKTAMSVVVKSNKLLKDSDSGSGRGYANSLLERKPSLLTPTAKESHTYLMKGEDLQLECIAEGFPTPKVEWVKIGFHELPERAEVESHGKLLTVEMVNEEDEGKYMCRAKNPHGEVVHYFHVTVEEPPEFEIEPQSQLVTIGADVVIKCVVKGNPQPSVAWRVNGQPLNDVPTSNRKVLKDGTISIHNAKPENSAVYQCEATNRHGTILVNANIMIMNIQPLILTENNLQYMAVEGKGVVMHCKVFSSPASSITWSKADSANAVEGERFSVHKNGSLEIHNIMKEDMGEYSCFAQNTEGKVAIAATLEVKDPTRIVDPPRDLRVLAGTTIQFSCQAEFDPSIGDDFEILWEKDGMALNGSENARYILNDGVLEIINVSFGDQGFYVCVARTPVDQDVAVAQLSVVDVPDPPEDVILSEHNGRSVKLQWIPGDDHNSSITEFVIEFEESQHEPGSWREMMRVPGNHHSALLKLHSHVDYRFRVYAINEVGRGRPSQATERYKTPASAPDKNPENIKIEGHLPHEMDINWEPLSPIEHNGPGLEYKVSYRRQGTGEDWTEHMVKRHSFLVKNTPTFVLYEIKIQTKNHVGWGPDPKIITAYSGEDFPSAAPEDVAVDVMNNTMMKVRWEHVHKDKLNGHLGGYRISYWRLRSLLDSKKTHGDKHTLTFSGERNHAVVTGLRPFSEFSLIVMAFNSRGNGPGSHPVSFKTPEGVPGQVAAFSVTNIQKHKVTLTWSPPVDANGVIIGFILQYQLINDTEELGSLMTLNISADSNKLHLQDLEALSKYKFYLRCCTRVGCGPAVSEERTTVPEARKSGSRFPPRKTTVSPVANATLSSIALLNISTTVSHNFANISWIPGTEQTESELYVAFMNNREGNWKISDALNSSKTFHIIEGLEPATEYTVRLMTKSWVDNSSIFEDVIRTSAKGLASIHGGISNQGWFIGLMCAIALLTLIVLIACFVNRNKGGKYSVKEKEDLHPDLESQGINDDTFCEYSDNDEKPLKSSQHSLNGDLKGKDSGDSMVDYGDEDTHFHEDGSFIGEYSGRKERVSMEIKGNNQSTA
ncbi:neural cell adhesion molecule L1-like protein isoform X3 [Sinocyclocheilus rhinocerous]|uniref:neural cell adhesion molecule L1-like protein isoform X3 n=1 Tax=Sinocyclocheilus rhinocerous TaxID=307959 RepID=UPI0007B8DA0D|nr:PREDICTED: neural cell adhesion molecule L1-like protein isoform X3 [Sinocyclocheilus rhinocerous]